MATDRTGKSIQETYAPGAICFGCGPANAKGLRIRSFETGPEPEAAVVCDWTPEVHHQAFEGVLNGGIIGTLMDCHGNWTAARHIMRRDGLDRPPTTVTADFHVKLRRPTPTDVPVHLTARATASEGPRVKVEVTLEAGGKITATCDASFVAVQEGHPAFGRS